MELTWDILSHVQKIFRQNSTKNRHSSDNSLVIISLFPTYGRSVLNKGRFVLAPSILADQ
jgi:hypothetical protein